VDREEPSTAPRRKADARQQLVDRATVLVEKARRKHVALAVGAETTRLIGEYPNCPMSYDELHDTIGRLAHTQGVAVKR
jgi:hypothetical protein